MTDPLAEISPAAADAPEPAAPDFTAIAMIDDDLRPLALERVPEDDRDAVVAFLGDADVLEDLLGRGMSAEQVAAGPDAAIEALTRPDLDHGLAFAKMGDVSARTQELIDRRKSMRQIAESIRETGGCRVVEFGPDDDLAGIDQYDIVFIDYYLDDKVESGERAEQIAGQVHDQRDASRRQQIVLMSTREGVRAMRSDFRRSARIEAASFAFVSKLDLDEEWKVKAHLDMLARGMQHSEALGGYINAVKASAKAAAEALTATIDDLDIGDFAYIQRIALHEDGHPLGDYLSWLLSSHLTALAFETGLREQQAVIDALEFPVGPFSPAEPSIGVASLYHNALFARNLGKLGGHPRATEDSPIADVPFVQLGDVFLTADRSSSVVILSPDCDLAFSTHGRPPDRNMSVILMFGDPNAVTTPADKATNTSTEGMMQGSEVYRIDWRFNTFRTVPLGELAKFLENGGFDLGNRDRLRPIYSIKLQHELGSHLTRVGPPIMPPISKHARGKIRYYSVDGVSDTTLDASELVVSHFKKKSTVRLTPALISKLKLACREHLDLLRTQLEAMPEGTEEEQKARRSPAAKVQALSTQIDGSETWIKLFGDKPLPTEGKCDRVGGCVYIAHGAGWVHPGPPAVVLVIGEAVDDGNDDVEGGGNSSDGGDAPHPPPGASDGIAAAAATAKQTARRPELKAKPAPRDT
ncbi:hypothetical protein K9B33_11550 [Sphingobium sp. 3R8]|uniref:hypothetical protein n=1 Tax=Sphingobium sp. 3R8 TaxID=2874921 RepID=UPI001CCA0FB4|nr:hypothetical protein [Sphingobium sp. 3R8]MBZ9648185.1 hypothetical protein [Sphingobium sp. 3R8]